MAKITLKNLCLNYPIYGTNARSFKSSIINIATGGKLKKNHGSITVEALKDISFELKSGDRLGLIGHNGAGKTTLLKTLAQIYTPSKGSLHIQGKTGSLFDISVGFDPEATGYENIILRGLLLGLSRKEIQTLIPDIENFAEIGEFMKMPIKTYSSGMVLRLAFGLITSTPSEILIIDEVVNVGDASFKAKAKNRIINLIHKSEIMILSTHDIKAISEFCTKVLWLEHGKIKMLDTTKTVLEAYKQSIKDTSNN